MSRSLERIRAAGDQILCSVADDPRYAHTSHLLIRVDGQVVLDEHLQGPEVAEVFSITKSVLASTLGCLAAEGRLPPLRARLADVLPQLRGGPAAEHTWFDVLTMTRGAAVDGPWDFDEVSALPGGQVARIASAPLLHQPGTTFTYDDAAPHLLSAAAAEILGTTVADFASAALFGPLGMDSVHWPADPDGISWGPSGVACSAGDLGRLGELWLADGMLDGRGLVDPDFFALLTTPHTTGGPPENVPYGFLTWLPEGMRMAGGWAGQHLLVVPAARAVVVTTGDAGFSPGPPPTDRLRPGWRPAVDLVRQLLLPALLDSSAEPVQRLLPPCRPETGL